MNRNFNGKTLPKELWGKGLDSSDKILISEIISLSKQSGGCYASDEHFAELIEESVKNASRRIQQLKKQGRIYVTRERNGSKWKRIIKFISLFEKDNLSVSKNEKDNFEKDNFDRVEKDKFEFSEGQNVSGIIQLKDTERKVVDPRNGVKGDDRQLDQILGPSTGTQYTGPKIEKEKVDEDTSSVFSSSTSVELAENTYKQEMNVIPTIENNVVPESTGTMYSFGGNGKQDREGGLSPFSTIVELSGDTSKLDKTAIPTLDKNNGVKDKNTGNNSNQDKDRSIILEPENDIPTEYKDNGFQKKEQGQKVPTKTDFGVPDFLTKGIAYEGKVYFPVEMFNRVPSGGNMISMSAMEKLTRKKAGLIELINSQINEEKKVYKKYKNSIINNQSLLHHRDELKGLDNQEFIDCLNSIRNEIPKCERVAIRNSTEEIKHFISNSEYYQKAISSIRLNLE